MKDSHKLRSEPNARRRQEDSDALNEALMATFPASDPLSMVNTLTPGAKDDPRHADTDEGPARSDAADQFRKLPLDYRQPQSDKDLGITVAFVLVLVAVLLMLHAASTYSFDVVASTQLDGIIAVPPM